MSVIELLIVSVGLSIDVFVAAVYMGGWIFKNQMEEPDSAEYPVWRYPVRNTCSRQSDHITSVIIHYQDEDSG